MKSSFYKEAETKRKLARFIMSAKILSMNEQCKKFEEAFSKKQKRKYSVFVSSGSMANLILIQAMLNLGKLKKNDKVGVSSLTWATNVMPLLQLGLVPVILDCSITTLNVPPVELKKHTKEIKALFLTNALGFSDDIQKIQKICKENNILFLEDNCESLGSKVGEKLLGNFSLASTFSFFIGHHMSTIEGGMICTDDEKLHDALVMARAHGWDRNLSAEKQKKLRKEFKIQPFYSRYTFYDLAYNGRPNEINGFIGNEQIKYLDEIIRKRQKNYLRFQKAVRGNSDFIPLEVGHMSLISNFSMPIVCRSAKLAENYRKKFSKNKIELRPIITGDISIQPFYKKYVKSRRDCPNAQLIHENGFYFGNSPELTEKEVKFLCQILKK